MKKLPRFGRLIDNRKKSISGNLPNGMKRFISISEVYDNDDGFICITKHLAMFVEGRGYLPIYNLLEAAK